MKTRFLDVFIRKLAFANRQFFCGANPPSEDNLPAYVEDSLSGALAQNLSDNSCM